MRRAKMSSNKFRQLNDSKLFKEKETNVLPKLARIDVIWMDTINIKIQP